MKPTKRIFEMLMVSGLVFFIAGFVDSAAAQSWVQLFPTGGPPVARHSHSAVLNTSSDRMTVYAGTSGACCLNDVWVLSNADGVGAASAWTQLSPTGGPPPGRQGHTAVIHDGLDEMVVFGGVVVGGSCASGFLTNDVWVLSNADGVGAASAWTQLSPTGAPPSNREMHSAVYDSLNNRMVVYGGDGSACGSFLDDVWVLTDANGQGATPTWVQLFPGGDPGARAGHTAVYDPGTNRMIVFGGQGVTGFLNDVWVLSNANGTGGAPTWTQLAPTGILPPARTQHNAIYDTATNSMTIFGGAATSGFSNDVWVSPTRMAKAGRLRGLNFRRVGARHYRDWILQRCSTWPPPE